MVFSLTRESSSRSVSDVYDCQMKGPASSTPYPDGKRMRRRRVMIDETKNQKLVVLSLQDYTSREHHTSFYSREEYNYMKESVKNTIRFLKYRMAQPSSCHLDFVLDIDICIRGLECMADEYVSMYRKRSREISMAAVFTCQNIQHSAVSNKAEAIAQAYKQHTTRAQSIAERWGYFDALDSEIKDETSRDFVIEHKVATAL
jgi:hypothetical protein